MRSAASASEARPARLAYGEIHAEKLRRTRAEPFPVSDSVAAVEIDSGALPDFSATVEEEPAVKDPKQPKQRPGSDAGVGKQRSERAKGRRSLVGVD